MNNFSKKLVGDYQKYMLKHDIIVNYEEAELDLESFATVYLSFADIDKIEDKKND